MASRKQDRRKATTSKREAPDTGEVLDLTAATALLKVSRPTFYRWLAQGKIKGFKAGTQWRFYRADLESFLRAEEPSALMVDSDALRAAVQQARKARGLKPVEWPEAETPEEATVIGTTNTIIGEAIGAGASDIHIEPEADSARIRYRVDGVLHEVMSLPKQAAIPIVSRLKLMGDMNVSERRVPQHGRISVECRGREYDVRVLTIPSVFGENAICRILDQASVLIGLDKLGLSRAVRAGLEAKLCTPNGLIVVTGPAGSGRTTTIYSCLNLINSPKLKICTIEDPVEYRLRGVMQVHVNRKAGLTFAVALRSFMRADPDIVMVGGLHDLETAEGCVNAAMTGHLVLTTMLPLDAPSVISRLIEMGVEPFLVSSALIAVLAQRLVRRVCPNCNEPYTAPGDVLRRLAEKTGLDLAGAKLVRGKGCNECRQTGYRGRTGLFEFLQVEGEVRDLVAKPASTEELRAAAIQSGMTTLLKDGIEKAMQGITTIEEVMRVLGG
ncbi:MAG: ATPase, T2SS/T4P/T4SS family [Armatimonadota bacterium]